LPSSESEAAVDQGRSKEPLCGAIPNERHACIPSNGLRPALGKLQAGTQALVARGEEEEGSSDPNPTDLNKVDVEDVCFLREVTGRVVWRIALKRGDVGSDIVVDGQGAEERAEDESARVEGEQDCLERRG
jgi:hypothetical protein